MNGVPNPEFESMDDIDNLEIKPKKKVNEMIDEVRPTNFINKNYDILEDGFIKLDIEGQRFDKNEINYLLFLAFLVSL